MLKRSRHCTKKPDKSIEKQFTAHINQNSMSFYVIRNGWRIVKGRFCHSLAHSAVIRCVTAGYAVRAPFKFSSFSTGPTTYWIHIFLWKLTTVFNFARPLGVFHQEKIVFWLPSIIPYMARRQNFPCRSCKLANDFVSLTYRLSSTTDIV